MTNWQGGFDRLSHSFDRLSHSFDRLSHSFDKLSYCLDKLSQRSCMYLYRPEPFDYLSF